MCAAFARYGKWEMENLPFTNNMRHLLKLHTYAIKNYGNDRIMKNENVMELILFFDKTQFFL